MERHEVLTIVEWSPLNAVAANNPVADPSESFNTDGSSSFITSEASSVIDSNQVAPPQMEYTIELQPI